MSDLLGLLLAGAVAGSAALLLIAGAGKVCRWRRVPDGDAIARALGISPGHWRRVLVATGTVECLTGAAALLGGPAVLVGSAIAALGAVFSIVLAHTRRAHVTGSCGCVVRDSAHAVTWRAQARAAFILGAGVAQAAAGISHPPAWTWPSFAVATGVLLGLLSVDHEWRTPRCHRRLWWPKRETAGRLLRHNVYKAMAASDGPFDATVGYRRAGCVEEFRFAPRRGGRVVVFRVTRPDLTGALAVQASIEAGAPPAGTP